MNDLERLVRRARAGETAAFAELVRRFQDMAFGYARAVLKDHHGAEDAAQEAFIEAYACLPRLQEPLAFPRWLQRIVYKHCDRQRRRGAGVEVVSTAVALERLVGGKDPAQIAEEDEMNRMLEEALGSLPAAERELVELYYYAGRPQREVAEFLGVNVNAVKNRLRRTRAQLKERLMDMAEEKMQQERPSKDDAFVDKVLRLVSPDKAKHSEAIFALFDSLGREDLSLLGRDGRVVDSSHDWQTSRIGYVGDRLATYMGVYDVQVRVGSARVRAAGENLTYTHADFGERFGDLMDQTVESALEAMRQQGYDIALSLGGAGFERYGYVPVWRSSDWKVDVADLLPYGTDVELQVFDPVYREDLGAIHARTNETLTGTVVRPVYRKNKEPLGFQGWMWCDRAGKPSGYVSGGDGGAFVYVDDQAGPADEVLKALAQIGRRAGLKQVHLRGLPYRSALGRILRNLPSCSIQTNPSLTYRARVINLESLFERLLPELSRRLAGFPLVQWEGDLVVANGDEEVALRIEGSDVSLAKAGDSNHAIRGGQEIVQLVLGSEAPAEIAAAGGVEFSGDAGPLAEVLFPAQDPVFGNQDL